MKKIFTLVAMMLLTLGAQAQLLTFDGLTDATQPFNLENGDFKITFTMGSKGAFEDKSVSFIPWGQESKDNAESFSCQLKPGGAVAKTSGERSIVVTVPSSGKLYIYARTGTASATDRTLTVQQNGSNVLDAQVVQEANSYSYTKEDQTTAYLYWTYSCDVKAGTAYVLTSAAINFFGFKFVAGEGGGGEGGGEGGEGGEGSDLPSYNAGTMTGTWSLVGSSADSGSLSYGSKYNKNTTSVTTITFPSSATKDGAWVYAAKVEGEFKTGDVITIQPFTVMSSGDYSGNTKYANILLYYEKDVEGTITPSQIADLTGSAAGALTVTDGHEEEGTPKEFTYTLESDYTNLFFARGGNTRINLMKVTITRGTTEIFSFKADKAVNDGVMYNIAGQQVDASYKGLVILNGKKVLMK